jgi:tetratricopeptide (TPR) repeat protein
MILLNKYLSLFFLVSFNFSLGQKYLENQYEYAAKLFEEEKFYDAITELKRLKFFDENNKYAFKTNKLIGLCYKEGGKLNKAIKYFILAELNAVDQENLYEAKILIIRTNILRRSTNNALKLLDDLENSGVWTSKTHEINYWRGWAYIFTDKWDNAAEEFSKISSDHELKVLCEETHDKKIFGYFCKISVGNSSRSRTILYG